jgi:hypothetical protein
MPAVARVGVSGHQHVAPAAAAALRRALPGLFRQIGASAAVSCLAAGADQIFAEAAIAYGLSLEVIVPCGRYAETLDGEARGAYARLLGDAALVTRLEFPEPSEDAYLAAGLRLVESVDVLLAVWDGGQARGPGGTGDIVACAESRMRPVYWFHVSNHVITRR